MPALKRSGRPPLSWVPPDGLEADPWVRRETGAGLQIVQIHGIVPRTLPGVVASSTP